MEIEPQPRRQVVRTPLLLKLKPKGRYYMQTTNVAHFQFTYDATQQLTTVVCSKVEHDSNDSGPPTQAREVYWKDAILGRLVLLATNDNYVGMYTTQNLFYLNSMYGKR